MKLLISCILALVILSGCEIKPEEQNKAAQAVKNSKSVIHYDIVCIDNFEYVVTSPGGITPHLMTSDLIYTCE